MKTILIVGLLLFFQFLASADTIETDSIFQSAERFRKAQNYDEAKRLYQEFLRKHPDFKPEETDVRFGLAESLFRLAQYDSAALFFENALTETRQIERPVSSVMTIYGRLGYIYRYVTSDLRKALIQFEEELSLITSYDSLAVTRVKFANSYNLATTYRLLENYEQALNHGFSSLSIAQEVSDDNQRSLLLSYSVIANILGDMEEFKRATDYHLKKIALSEALYGPLQPELADYYNNAALDFLSAREFTEAQVFFQKAQKSITNPAGNEYLLSVSHRNIATIYQTKRDYFNAKKHLDTALTYSSSSSFQLASTTRNLGAYYKELNQFDSALLMYQQALSYAIKGFEWKSLDENPSEDQFFSDPFYYRLLKEKAQCWLEKYEFDRDLYALTEARKSYALMDKVTQTYRDNFTMESSKLFFQSWNYSNYENAIKTLYELYQNTKDEKYIQEAWHLIEMNKSVLLLENLMKAEKADLAGITDSLKTSIAQVSEQVWNKRSDLTNCQQDENCEESQVIKLRADLSSAQRELNDYQMLVQEQSPNYYRLAYDKDLISLSNIQQSLEKDVIMLNYFATNKNYYLISASKNGTSFHSIKRDSILDQSLTAFLAEVSGETLQHQDLKTGFDKLTKSGNLLFSQLIPKTLSSKQFKKLIVVPDGLLSLLPFEALISSLPPTSAVNFSALPYLIKSHQINYGYSATLWFRNRKNKPLQKDARLLGFGTPSLKNNPKFSNLPGTVKESEALKILPNATVYIGLEAQESTFKEKCIEANIIHLAVHNDNDIRNPLNSQLIFNENTTKEDGVLHLYELYGLQIKARLVVLSACATGVGDWQQGEGAYHMGRGFLYHGNPAMIISLWKVRDATAAGLMEKLYYDLSEGIDSDEALRNTKLEYIDRSDEITAHPSNWASFIGIGKTRIQQNSMAVWYVVIAILGLLFFYLIARQFGTKKSQTA